MWNWIEKLSELQKEEYPFALISVIKCLGSSPCKEGAKMIVREDGEFWGTVGGGRLEFMLLDFAADAIKKGTFQRHEVTLGPELNQCCGGVVELTIEVMNKEPVLYLFGAGHIGQELCKVLEGTKFKVVLIDEREAWFDKLETPFSGTYISDINALLDTDKPREGMDYALIMTHSHTLDYDLLEKLIPRKLKFLGLIGSKSKRQRFHNQLIREGISEGMNQVKCPIGLDIGGTSPKEIAISAAAGLMKIHYER